MSPDANGDRTADRMAITEQMYRYCRSVDRLDVPLGHGVFHDDATADFGDFVGTGRGWIDHICVRHRDFLTHSHQVTNVIITFDAEDANRAGSEAYVHAALHRRVEDGSVEQSQIWARYIDRWSRRDGVWAIDHRLCVTDFGAVSTVTAFGAFGGATRDGADPSYAALGEAA